MSVKSKNAKPYFISLTTHLLAALMCAAIISTLIMCAFSKLMCTVDIPLYMTVPLATIAVGIATLLSGMLFAALQGEKGLIYGFAFGVLIFIIIWIATVIRGDTAFSGLATLKLIALCCCGAIGGFIGAAIKIKAKRKR